ncbi:O-antigen ligase family protein [bacterium]|nr:O-antigen ligase family protein [bacterium]
MEEVNKETTYNQTELYRHPRSIQIRTSTVRFLLVLAHIPLAFLFRELPILSTLHAYITLSIGVFIALTAKDISKIIPIVTYILGAEVLWRMTNANIFWEFGKYSIAFMLILALFRFRKLEHVFLPVFYFLLLIPSTLGTIEVFGFSNTTRNAISFNLSGPFAASVCMLFFLQIKANYKNFNAWLWSAIFPIVGILSLATYDTITANEIQFFGESLFITSGGFGPNQVSAILGLGGMLLIMIAIQKEKTGNRFWILSLALVILTQTVLTFSRGGVLNILIALPLALIHLLGSPSKLVKGILVFLFIFLIAFFLILPELEAFTGGALESRYSDFGTTGRLEMVEADIDLWKQYPLFGVGTGISMYMRSVNPGLAAHTEYSRMIAEHGIPGIFSLAILAFLAISTYFRAPNAFTRATVVGLLAWAMLQMSHNAMRLVSPSVILGLAMVQWGQERTKNLKETAGMATHSRANYPTGL